MDCIDHSYVSLYTREETRAVVSAYFIQLTRGCGDERCDNPKCVTGGKTDPLKANSAAAQAVELARKHKSGVCMYALKAVVSDVNKATPTTKEPSPISSTGGEPMEIEPSCTGASPVAPSPSYSFMKGTMYNNTGIRVYMHSIHRYI